MFKKHKFHISLPALLIVSTSYSTATRLGRFHSFCECVVIFSCLACRTSAEVATNSFPDSSSTTAHLGRPEWMPSIVHLWWIQDQQHNITLFTPQIVMTQIYKCIFDCSVRIWRLGSPSRPAWTNYPPFSTHYFLFQSTSSQMSRKLLTISRLEFCHQNIRGYKSSTWSRRMRRRYDECTSTWDGAVGAL